MMNFNLVKVGASISFILNANFDKEVITMYDFIGDIHGHASKLVSLMKKLGYSQKGTINKTPIITSSKKIVLRFITMGVFIISDVIVLV
jgi:hypothetical protein